MNQTLDSLQPGQSARVVRLEGAPAVTGRLMEIGLIPGRMARLVRRAPLADPIELLIDGTRLAVRRGDAAGVVVEPSAG